MHPSDAIVGQKRMETRSKFADRSRAWSLGTLLAAIAVAALSGTAAAQQSQAKTTDIRHLTSVKRSEFNEWTMFSIGNQRVPHYIRLSSIEQFDSKVAVEWKFLPDSSDGLFRGRQFPEGISVEDLVVFDCAEPVYALANRSIIDKSGEVVFQYKWGDPEFLVLSNGPKLISGSVAMLARNIVCQDELRTPLVRKSELASLMRFPSIRNAISEVGNFFYLPPENPKPEKSRIDVVTITKWPADMNISDILPKGMKESSKYRFEVAKTRMACDKNKMSFVKKEYYGASNQLVYMTVDLASESDQVDIDVTSRYGALRRIVCNLGR
jgi:hypothetical protein